MKIFANILISTLIIISIISMIMVYLSVYLSPRLFVFSAPAGLTYPYVLISNVFVLFYLIFRKSKFGYFSAILILVGFPVFADYFAFNVISEKEIKGDNIKVMTYNVRMFNSYEWIDDDSVGQKILKLIETEKPDILCMQEFYSKVKDVDYIPKIQEIMQSKHYFYTYKKDGIVSGNIIFSRFPIIQKGYVSVGTSSQKCIYSDIKIKNDTFRVYSLHLASVHFDDLDYELITQDFKNNTQGYSDILRKMLNAYKKRAHEVEIISPKINSSKYRTIVCGDFNDVPVSYTYKKLKGDYKDAFIESGFGIGNTYRLGILNLRLDYILFSSSLESKEYKLIKKRFSDHYPMSCRIYF